MCQDVRTPQILSPSFITLHPPAVFVPVRTRIGPYAREDAPATVPYAVMLATSARPSQYRVRGQFITTPVRVGYFVPF
ncbi:hypothetical protein SCOCK_20089 [Actinacidiphila cocklensis]|uniref:Uncharacterized protein n=1 Tax=Actinacidiphila cocklensis TaxID=887465 RepID=A0A9W4GQ55_9ACTN|nr:hypothetical protein SCOCK_20089 [Actinacidiphila cocklensis]